MEHDHQALDVPAPEIVVDNGDANSAADATGEPPAVNGANGDHHLVDADDFKNIRLAIGTLGRTILEISDNLAAGDTRHIDIRLRQNNRSRPADGGGVAPVVQAEDAPAGNVIAAGPAQAEAVQPGNNQAASPPGSRPQSSSRLKITVAADGSDPEDADEKYLDKMRGWLMTVATLVVGITFQAAIQPPDWVKREVYGDDRSADASRAAAAAPSPQAANQWKTLATTYEGVAAALFAFFNWTTLTGALLAVVMLLVTNNTRKTVPAKITTKLVNCTVMFYTVSIQVTVAMCWNPVFLTAFVVVAISIVVYIRLRVLVSRFRRYIAGRWGNLR